MAVATLPDPSADIERRSLRQPLLGPPASEVQDLLGASRPGEGEVESVQDIGLPREAGHRRARPQQPRREQLEYQAQPEIGDEVDGADAQAPTSPRAAPPTSPWARTGETTDLPCGAPGAPACPSNPSTPRAAAPPAEGRPRRWLRSEPSWLGSARPGPSRAPDRSRAPVDDAGQGVDRELDDDRYTRRREMHEAPGRHALHRVRVVREGWSHGHGATPSWILAGSHANAGQNFDMPPVRAANVGQERLT